MGLECIFENNDLFEVERVKDLLKKNNIEVMVKKQYTQNLFGGYKLFAGYDPVVGSIQVFVNKANIDTANELIRTSIIGRDIEELTEREIDEKTDDSVNKNNRNNDATNRTIFICFALAMVSVFIIPFIINLFILNKLRKERKAISIMLFAISIASVSLSLMAIACGNPY